MSLNPQVTLQVFNKWEMDFFEQIKPMTRTIRARYILIVKNYLTRWEKSEPIIDCSA
jgi:hypothetical protein